MSRLTDNLYSYIKAKGGLVSLADICNDDEFKDCDRKDISAALRMMGSQKIVFRSLKDGKAYYSTDSSKGEAVNPTKAWIAGTASALGGFVNRDGSNTDILVGGPQDPHKQLFDALDKLTELTKDLYGEEDLIKGDESTVITDLTYHQNRVFKGDGYSVSIPDGFTLVTGDEAKEQYGETRDFMAFYTTNQFDDEDALIKIYPGNDVQFTTINSEDLNVYFPVIEDYLFRFEQVLYANQMAMMNMYGDAYEVKTENSIAWCSYMDSSTPDRSGGYHFFYVNIPTKDKARMFRIDISDIVVENYYDAKKLVDQILKHFTSEMKLKEYDRLDGEKYTSSKLTGKLAEEWKQEINNLFGNVVVMQNIANQTMQNTIQLEARLGNINTDQTTIIREFKKMARVLVDDETELSSEILDQVANFFNKTAELNKDTKEIFDLRDEAMEFVEGWKEVSVTLKQGGEKVVGKIRNLEDVLAALNNPVLMEERNKVLEEQYQSILVSIEKASTKKEFTKVKESLKELNGYKDSEKLIDKCDKKIKEIEKNEKNEKEYQSAVALLNGGSLESFDKGINQLKKLGNYKEAKKYVEESTVKRDALVEKENQEKLVQEAEWLQKRKDALLAKGLASCTNWNGYFAYVKQDGTVTVDASKVQVYGKADTSTVVEAVKKWKNIKAVAAVKDGGVVGLKWDGTCEYAVTKTKDKEFVLSEVSKWKNIVYIDSNDYYCVGLDRKGNCHTTPYHIYSHQDHDNECAVKVGSWTNVESVICGDSDSACCVNRDGTVKTTDGYFIEASLKDVKLASQGSLNFVWYESNGKFTQQGSTQYVKTLSLNPRKQKPIDIKVHNKGIYVLYEDNVMRQGSGDTPNVIGMNPYPMGSLYITSDGYVHKNGDTYKIFDDFSYYRDHDKMVALQKQKEAEERARREQEEKERKEKEEKQKAEYRSKEVCQYCGGSFKKTLFGTKCTVCGKKKDY